MVAIVGENLTTSFDDLRRAANRRAGTPRRGRGPTPRKTAPAGARDVGTGVHTSANRLSMRTCVGFRSRISLEPSWSPNPEALGEQVRGAADPAHARLDLGLRPEVDLARGLKVTLQSFRVL
jgi:nucleoside-diphosphate-sugar epimerase